MARGSRWLAPVLGGVCLAAALRGQTIEVVHRFPVGGPPRAPLVVASDGFLYGTSSGGGIDDQGFVFRIDTAGNLVTLHRFSGPEGQWPSAGLLQDSDGDFYGTTVGGGANDNGTVFRMDAAGHVVVLHDFDYAQEGASSESALIQGSDGAFYGTTSTGGPGLYGAVFRMDGSGFLTVLHAFSGMDGSTPRAALLQASDGRFYGTTAWGGQFGGGTVFRLNQDGGGFVSLHSFSGNAEPANLEGELIQGLDGLLYGTGSSGGDGQGGGAHGSVFRMDGDGNITTIHFFSGLEGGNPPGALLAAADGSLYGTAQSTAFRMDYLGGLVVIHTFAAEEGAGVREPLVQGPDGRLYGTAFAGGSAGAGTVFALDLSGDCTVLHTFAEEEGQRPIGGVIEGTDGFLYGANAFGGSNLLGTIYRMTRLGRVSPIRQFEPADVGAYPHAPLLRTPNGDLFGATGAYGSEGTVFRLSAGGLLTTLGQFGPGNSATAVIHASDGNLYGSTQFGGAYDAGRIFRIDPSGSVTTFHDFGADGPLPPVQPAASLIQGLDGALYGTTLRGGAGTYGTVFRIDLAGNLTLLHEFNSVDGELPTGPVTQTPDGTLYGTTQRGGAFAQGTVFKIDSMGAFTIVHSFTYPDGAQPTTGLLLASDGYLYGTTPFGGSFGETGTVFGISPAGVVKTLGDFDSPSYAHSTGSLIEATDGHLYFGANAVFRVILSGFAVSRLAPLNGPASGGQPRRGRRCRLPCRRDALDRRRRLPRCRGPGPDRDPRDGSVAAPRIAQRRRGRQSGLIDGEPGRRVLRPVSRRGLFRRIPRRHRADGPLRHHVGLRRRELLPGSCDHARSSIGFPAARGTRRRLHAASVRRSFRGRSVSGPLCGLDRGARRRRDFGRLRGRQLLPCQRRVPGAALGVAASHDPRQRLRSTPVHRRLRRRRVPEPLCRLGRAALRGRRDRRLPPESRALLSGEPITRGQAAALFANAFRLP